MRTIVNYAFALALLCGQAQASEPLNGAFNFRDIGGYKTSDGRMIRSGVVYRSAHLAEITTADVATLNSMQINREFDLRCPFEIDARPSHWTGTPPEYSTPFLNLCNRAQKQKFREKDPLWKAYAFNAVDQAAGITSMVREIADGRGASLLHCTGGNDRTGVAIAILMRILGVSLADIEREYIRSNQDWQTSAAVAERHRLLAATPQSDVPGWPGLDPNNIDMMFKAIDRMYGSFENYERRGLGLSKTEIVLFQSKLLEPAR